MLSYFDSTVAKSSRSRKSDLFWADSVEFARTQTNLVVRPKHESQDARRWAVPLASRPRKLNSQPTDRAKGRGIQVR
ncbi:MAG TPA: hypothetical protein DDX19_11905 [Rhodopirellula baltica]|nr:hypothetical protein [Rhodopirellula baltica]